MILTFLFSASENGQKGDKLGEHWGMWHSSFFLFFLYLLCNWYLYTSRVAQIYKWRQNGQFFLFFPKSRLFAPKQMRQYSVRGWEDNVFQRPLTLFSNFISTYNARRNQRTRKVQEKIIILGDGSIKDIDSKPQPLTPNPQQHHTPTPHPNFLLSNHMIRLKCINK